jgi:two-component system LytT family response regulator
MKITTLVVDDEPLGREAVRVFLKADPEIEVIGECETGRQTVEAIARHNPHLVFLDVQMPDLDGFSVVDAVGPQQMPLTIFVTAYDKYALRAFDVHAMDYLLKPFDETRFFKALDRAKNHLRKGRWDHLGDKLEELLRERQGSSYAERFVIKSSGKVVFLKSGEIDWIEAEGNYLRLHVGKDSYLQRGTMNSVQERLDPKRFVRIHRSTIVNVEKVKELRPWPTGEYVVLMHNGKELTLSRGFKEQLPLLVGETI